jgi:hypothetical protein
MALGQRYGSLKAGLGLNAGSFQFVVIEAKMFSNLSRGAKNALEYDQAARNVRLHGPYDCQEWNSG